MAVVGSRVGISLRSVLERLQPVRPALGVALGGGGARGLAHIGVVKVLEEAGIRPAAVAGTSMGGLVAIAWAGGMTAAAMEALAVRTRVQDVLGPDRTGMGVSSGERIGRLIVEAVGCHNLEDLPVPCAVVATEIISGTRRVLDRGPIDLAAQATTAIPGLFSPVVKDGCVLVDGGMLAPLPVAEVMALGPRQVVAVDVSAERARPIVAEPALGLVPRYVASSLGVLRLLRRERTVDIVVKAFELQAVELVRLTLEVTRPALVLRPRVGQLRMDQFDRAAEAIAAGEAAAREALPAILRLVARQ